MDLARKLEILAEATKYDASCASGGTTRRNSVGGRGIGSTEGAICHSYAPDGCCISLLKTLLTNACAFDCLYCVNRSTSNVPRARFTVEEVVGLMLDFYRFDYFEGVFLSPGISRSPDYTMSEVVRVARSLREKYDFRGYIHSRCAEAPPVLPTAPARRSGEGGDLRGVRGRVQTRRPACRLRPGSVPGSARQAPRDVPRRGAGVDQAAVLMRAP